MRSLIRAHESAAQLVRILRNLLSVRAACAILLLPGFLLLPCFVRMVTGLPLLLCASLHSRSHRTMIVLLFCWALLLRKLRFASLLL